MSRQPRRFAPPALEYRTIAKKPPPEPPKSAKTKTARPLRKRAAPRKPIRLSALPATPGTPRKKAAAAGPRRAVASRRDEPAEVSRLDQLQRLIIESLEDDKAEGVVTLDLAGRATFADRMVVATGIADRQIAAMAQHLEEKLRGAGLKRVQMEGTGGSDWVLIDAGDIVVHLFKPEARTLYGLERMWGAELDEEQSTAV